MESSVVNGLRLAFGALYSIISYLFSWIFALFYLLATPFLYLLHGLLQIALFPLQILSKFEVRQSLQALQIWQLITIHILTMAADMMTGILVLCDWGRDHRHHRWPIPPFLRKCLVRVASITVKPNTTGIGFSKT